MSKELVETSVFSRFLKATGKEIESSYHFEGQGEENTFSAIRLAEEKAKELGYKVGIMCIDEPIAISSKHSYIAKWYNIEMKEWPFIEGMLISECFRREDVTLYIFKKEN